MIVDIAGKQRVRAMPAGTVVQLSFDHLVLALRLASTIKEDETISHFEAKPERGVIAYRIEKVQR